MDIDKLTWPELYGLVDYEGLVIEFMVKYKQAIPTSLQTHIAAPVRKLRQALIWEEANEFNLAANQNNIVEIADALADLLYVTFGTALAYGIPIAEVFLEVHRSNMSKAERKSENGKVEKGPYSPADIASILFPNKIENKEPPTAVSGE